VTDIDPNHIESDYDDLPEPDRLRFERVKRGADELLLFTKKISGEHAYEGALMLLIAAVALSKSIDVPLDKFVDSAENAWGEL
jgi:hypothetical protein